MSNNIEALIADMKTTAEKANEHSVFTMAIDTQNVLALIAALEQAQQELIKPLAIGELIQRLENQTGEPWGKRFLEGFDISEEPADGWVLVPETANITMIKAGGKAAREYMEECGGNSPQIIYKAMIAAAPKSGAK